MRRIDIRILFKQFLRFFLVSGIGYIIDWLLYFTLLKIGISIKISNFISMSLAASYVFVISSKKIFKNENSKLDIKYKYLIYIAYQFVLIIVASYVISLFTDGLVCFFTNHNYLLLVKYAKYIAKIINTPITLLVNFLVMKNLIEKI